MIGKGLFWDGERMQLKSVILAVSEDLTHHSEARETPSPPSYS